MKVGQGQVGATTRLQHNYHHQPYCHGANLHTNIQSVYFGHHLEYCPSLSKSHYITDSVQSHTNGTPSISDDTGTQCEDTHTQHQLRNLDISHSPTEGYLKAITILHTAAVNAVHMSRLQLHVGGGANRSRCIFIMVICHH